MHRPGDAPTILVRGVGDTEVPMRLIGLAVILAVSPVLAPLAAEAQSVGERYQTGFLGPETSSTNRQFLVQYPLLVRPLMTNQERRGSHDLTIRFFEPGSRHLAGVAAAGIIVRRCGPDH